jgi:hypothetical protein
VGRGSGQPIYSQPFDHDGYGGAIDYSQGTPPRRYNTVIYFFGEFNSATVVDSTQLEIANYLDKDGVAFADSANLWIIGSDLCEDEALTDPAWTDANGNQTTNAAFFWTNLAGLTAVPGGCINDDGHIAPPTDYKYYLVGQAGTCLSGITKAAGYWDCPFRKHPDDGASTSTATSIMKYADDLAAGKFAMAYKRHTSGSKVVTSFVGLDHFSSSQERDCVTQAILGDACFDVGIPNPKTSCTINTSVPNDVPSTERMVLHQNRPNPFNPITNIKFNLPSKSKATLKIYDIAGREVRTLVDGTLENGEHSITWFGKDNNGRDVTSGVYFYRLDAGKETSTKKMVLLR